MPDEYISREAALRAVQKQRGANRSPAQSIISYLAAICAREMHKDQKGTGSG